MGTSDNYFSDVGRFCEAADLFENCRLAESANNSL